MKTKIWSLLKRLYFLFPDRLYLQIAYYLHLGERLNLQEPKTFNEKLQWLKLYDRRDEYIQMVDKVLVKKLISEKIGNKYIIPTLAVYDNISEINFSELPNQFVLKTNNGGGGDVLICKDKSTIDKAYVKSRFRHPYFTDIYKSYREWPYKNVVKKIICEKYMTDHGNDLVDYKVHNFNGEPKFILVCSNRYNKSGVVKEFYTVGWEKMNVSRQGQQSKLDVRIPRPEQLDEILQLSRILSQGIPFVRTDFYIIEGKVYFGELTFYPASGFAPFVPKEWDSIFGQWLNLPVLKYKNK